MKSKATWHMHNVLTPSKEIYLLGFKVFQSMLPFSLRLSSHASKNSFLICAYVSSGFKTE